MDRSHAPKASWVAKCGVDMLFLLAYGLARNCGQPNETLVDGEHRHDHAQQQPILRLS